MVTERATPPPLFGLASHGVYLAGLIAQTRGALLPHLFTLTRREAGGIFSVALSVACTLEHKPPAVNRHAAL